MAGDRSGKIRSVSEEVTMNTREGMKLAMQLICKDLLKFGKFSNFQNFGVAEYIAYLGDLQHKISKYMRWRT